MHADHNSTSCESEDSIDVIQQCICTCVFSQDGDIWPTPQCWCRTACQSTHQTAVSDSQSSAHGGPCVHRHIIIIIAHVLCICAWSSGTLRRREVNLALSVSSKSTLSLLYTAACFSTPVTCCCRAPRHAQSQSAPLCPPCLLGTRQLEIPPHAHLQLAV